MSLHLIQLRRAAAAATFGLFSFTTTACDASLAAAPQLAYGPAQSLGNGVVRAYVELDAAGKPAAIGVALSEAAFENLPQTFPDGSEALILPLQLPAAARGTGYEFAMVDWNPGGHEPAHVYTVPHFDFHFFLISQEESDRIAPADPEYAAKAGRFPPADFLPAGYVAGSTLGGVAPVDAAVPTMGMHWVHEQAPEIQDGAAHKPFTTTFIYGTWDGLVNFVEPMITKAYLEVVKEMPNGVTLPVTTPARAVRPGLYPTRYSIRFDRTAQEYRVAIEGLVPRS